jgi:hypothetical protein
VIRRLPPLLRGSITLRAAAALAFVLVAYVFLHARFAAFDAMLARTGLSLLGFEVSGSRPGDLVVRAGADFDVYAVVTGSCSSAAGVLGLAAVSFVLLPGRIWRRWAGGLAAAALFVVFNLVRICSIIVLGWWLASTDPDTVLRILLSLSVLLVAVAVAPHGRLFLRVGSLLVAGLSGVLAYDVWRGEDYLAGMASYHALAGPMLTFGGLAVGIVVLWRAVVGGSDAGQRGAPPVAPA